MKIGTKSVLFGVHCFALHGWFVALAWWKLYGFPFDPRLWVAFFVHDLGYFGKPNMDGPEGETHVKLGAKITGFLFDWHWGINLCKWCTDTRGHRNSWRILAAMDTEGSWYDFCLLHSRFYSKKTGRPFSRLCVADKLAISVTPQWLYLLQTNLSGEIHEYMKGNNARTPAAGRSQRKWLSDVQDYCRAWAYEHKDLRSDLWTGTKRDLAIGPVEQKL